jgi:hypothetical protein
VTLQWLFWIGVAVVVAACVGYLIAQQALGLIRRQL